MNEKTPLTDFQIERLRQWFVRDSNIWFTADSLRAALTECGIGTGAAPAPSGGPLDGKYGEVLRPFVALMDRELHANSDKGDRSGWLSMDANTALLEVYWHVAKLSAAVKNNDGPRIEEHSADVANMAMMVLDVCGGIAGRDAAPAETAPQPDRDPIASKSHDVAREAGGGVVEAAKVLLRMHLDNAEVHPCDTHDDAQRAAQCSPEVQRLYAALAAHEAAQQDAGDAETRAWEITFTSAGERQTRVYQHNAIGDYRLVDPSATVKELVYRTASQPPAVESGPSEAALRDAEHAEMYRWLLENGRATAEHWGGRWSIVIEGSAPKDPSDVETVDAAIRAAIAASKETQQNKGEEA